MYLPVSIVNLRRQNSLAHRTTLESREAMFQFQLMLDGVVVSSFCLNPVVAW